MARVETAHETRRRNIFGLAYHGRSGPAPNSLVGPLAVGSRIVLYFVALRQVFHHASFPAGVDFICY